MKVDFVCETPWELTPLGNPSDLQNRFFDNSRHFLIENASLRPKAKRAYHLGEVSYSDLNEFGFRCDSFDEISKADKVFIFIGCSITFGLGIKKEDTWAYKMYEELKSKFPGQNVPFINLAFPASGIDFAIRNLRNFINRYNIKKVDGIFGLNINHRRFEVCFNKTLFLCIPPLGRRMFNPPEEDLMAKTEKMLANDAYLRQRLAEQLSSLKDIAKSVQCESLLFGCFLQTANEASFVTRVANESGNDFCFGTWYDPIVKDFGDDLAHVGPESHDAILSKMKEKLHS